MFKNIHKRNPTVTDHNMIEQTVNMLKKKCWEKTPK